MAVEGMEFQGVADWHSRKGQILIERRASQWEALFPCTKKREQDLFPGMLPKKAEGKSLLLGRALQAAVKKTADEAAFPQFSAAYICFIHFYTPDTPISVMRDYDNLETRPVLDILAASCLGKKNFSAVFHRMEFGDTNHAEIFVMEPQDMIFWLSGRKKEGCQ